MTTNAKADDDDHDAKCETRHFIIIIRGPYTIPDRKITIQATLPKTLPTRTKNDFCLGLFVDLLEWRMEERGACGQGAF